MKTKITIDIEENNRIIIQEDGFASMCYDLRECVKDQRSLLKNIVDSLDDYLEFMHMQEEEDD